jgi:hypothetical protein
MHFSRNDIAPDLSHGAGGIVQGCRCFLSLGMLRGGTSTAQLKSGAGRLLHVASPWARRDFRPTRMLGDAARLAGALHIFNHK